jgi:hypothetical protein
VCRHWREVAYDEFDVPEAGSNAAAEVIRRYVERTNPEAPNPRPLD